MTLPSLPSDSLYKFISFFGMSLTLLCFYFLFTESTKIKTQVIELNARNEEIRKQETQLWKEVKEIQKEAEYISKRFSVKNPFAATDTSYSWTMTFKGIKAEEIVSDTIKQLVNSFQSRLKVLGQKKIESETNEYRIDELQKDFESNSNIFGILAVVGVIICMIGFNLWYFKVQKPNDQKALKEVLSLPYLSPVCQSCLVRFEHYEYSRGKEKDGITANSYFCSLCYENGQFINPEMTLSEMEAELTSKLKDSRFKSGDIYEKISELKKAQRWNKKSRY